MAFLWENWAVWVWPAVILVGSIVLALLVHWLLFVTVKGLTKRRGGIIATALARHTEGPARWVLPLLAVELALPALPVRMDVVQILGHIVGLGLIATVAWVFILLREVLSDTLYARYRMEVSDNLAARRIRTQTMVLRKIFTVVVFVITAGVMLMTIPAIRQLGTSVLASAGTAGIVVGMAMKSSLSNLIAGLQIAFTAPIRIEDW